jgi:hypothetical protein
MPESLPRLIDASAIQQAHQLYGQLTGQNLSLRFDRERLWYEFLRAGYTLQDLRQVITYLQKEIRYRRRNVGALKLSNLLQLDRFEEDLNIRHVRLHAALPTDSNPPPPPELSAAEQECGRQRALDHLRQLRDNLRRHRL